MTETTAFPEATAAPSVPSGPTEMPSHSLAFRVRRALNWFPLGLAYAFLYMGRYNLNVSKTAMGDVLSKAEFGEIFGVGAIVYGWAFVINGPLTDRIGGRRSMLIGVMGALIANVLMGLTLYAKVTQKTLLISKTLGIEGKKLLTPEDDFDALRDFNHADDGTKTAI